MKKNAKKKNTSVYFIFINNMYDKYEYCDEYVFLIKLLHTLETSVFEQFFKKRAWKGWRGGGGEHA